jgi:hypothetical protein
VRPIFACFLAVAVIAGSPVGAQDKSGAEAKAQVDPTDRLVENYWDQMLGGHFNEAIAIARDLKATDAQGQAMVAAMRASALLGLKHEGEARRLISEARKLDPQSSVAARFLFFGGLLTDHYEVSADALDDLLARFPDEVLEFEPQTMSAFLRNEPKGQDRRNEDRRISLARIGFGGEAHGDYIAIRALGILVDRGDTAGAAEMLTRIDEPELIENLLIQKRYAALWPRLTEIAGPHLSKVRASSVATAQKAYLLRQEDHDLLASYANALREAGRLEDANALRSKLPQTPADMASADERMGWAINHVAISLYESGNIDDADRLFSALNNASMSDGGWRVSMIINHLEMLVSDGKYELALRLLDGAEASAKKDGSDYARQLVRRLRFCTMVGLGRRAEAEKIRPDLIAHAGDAYHATIDALLCAGDMGEAERISLAALHDSNDEKRKSFEEDFVRALQPVPLTSDDPSKWQGRWTELRKRPEISREYDRLGRDMPADLLPPKPTKQ